MEISKQLKNILYFGGIVIVNLKRELLPLLHNEEKLLVMQNKHLLVMIICWLIAIVTQTRLLIIQIGEMCILYKAHL